MHPVVSDVHARLHRQDLHAAAARRVSGAAPLPRPGLPERLTAARRRTGYRLVEVGLRLAIGRVPPSRISRPPAGG